jgi:hypothetical protein
MLPKNIVQRSKNCMPQCLARFLLWKILTISRAIVNKFQEDRNMLNTLWK